MLVSLVSQSSFGMNLFNFNVFGGGDDYELVEEHGKKNKNLRKSIAPDSYIGQYARDARKQAETLAENILPVFNKIVIGGFEEVRKTCGTFINPSLYFDRERAYKRLECKVYTLREQREVCDKIELVFVEERKKMCAGVIEKLNFFNDKEISQELINEFKISLNSSSFWIIEKDQF